MLPLFSDRHKSLPKTLILCDLSVDYTIIISIRTGNLPAGYAN
jgi:hypothetical protein